MTADLKQVVQEYSLDAWICHYFRVLPTDQRFKDLSSMQKQFLYTSFLETAPDVVLHHNYHAEKRNLTISEEQEQSLMKMGYTKQQILRIRAHLKKAMEK